MKTKLDLWSIHPVISTLRNHPKYKLALQAYNSICLIQLYLKTGCKLRDIPKSDLMLYVTFQIRLARNCLLELGLFEPKFDKISRVHLSYISSLISDC